MTSYGKYTVLVTGPFGELSSEFALLVDYIARERAMLTIKFWDTKPAFALAVHRRALVRSWAKHIVNRWCDAVSNRPVVSHTTEIYLAADEF